MTRENWPISIFQDQFSFILAALGFKFPPPCVTFGHTGSLRIASAIAIKLISAICIFCRSDYQSNDLFFGDTDPILPVGEGGAKRTKSKMGHNPNHTQYLQGMCVIIPNHGCRYSGTVALCK